MNYKTTIWTREQYEDFFHTIISSMLPELDKRLIRPSYQSVGGLAAKNTINQQYNDGVSGFTYKDDFIYFRVDFEGYKESFTGYGNPTIQRFVDVSISFYGENSALYCLKVISLIRISAIIDMLEKNGLYLYNTDTPSATHENINNEWWERHDFKITFNENLVIEEPESFKTLSADEVALNPGDINVIVKED